MSRRLVIAALAAAALTTTQAHASNLVCRPAGKPLGTIIEAHGGGWVAGQPDPCDPGARAGYIQISVDYPLGSIPAAVAAVKRAAARQPRPVFGTGGSAGAATILDAAATPGTFDGVVTFAAPMDLAALWPTLQSYGYPTTPLAELHRLSPLWRPLRIPALILQNAGDPVVPAAQAVAYARTHRCAHARLLPYVGHAPSPAEALLVQQIAVRWMRSRRASCRRRLPR